MSLPVVKCMGEGLARFTSRRKFLGRSAARLFGIVAACMAELTLIPSASADSYCTYMNEGTECRPPDGKFCNSIDSSYCDGADCAQDCTINTNYYPNTGCWCTQTRCVGSGSVYYQCCDCFCPNDLECGCSRRVSIALPC